MSEWVLQKAAEFCASVRDGTHDSPKSVEGGGKPLVTSKVVKQGVVRVEDAYLISEKDYRKINERSKVDRWDILMTMIGTVGECAIVKDDPDYAIKNIALFKMSGDEEKAKWLYYYLTSPMGQGALRGNFRGSSQQYISLDQLRNLEIPVPEKNVRSQIVAILSDYDSAIDNARRQIALLEEAAMRLYREWFVVNADPKWEKMSVGDFAELLSGYAFKSSDFRSAGTYKIITIKNVKAGLFDDINVDRISEIPKSMPSHCKLENGDILVSLTGNVGRTCLVCGNNCLLNQRVAKIKSEFPSYAYCAFRSPQLQSLMNGLSTGTAQQNLSPIKLSAAKWVLPEKGLLQCFEENASVLVRVIILLFNQIRSLAEARDRLLPKLMRGEVSV